MGTSWVGLLTFAVHLLDIRPGLVGVWCDDAIYVEMGASLASGHGLTVASLPFSPESAKYPIGWPALLALLSGLGVDLGSTAGLTVVLALNALMWALAAQLLVSVVVPALGGGRVEQALVGLLVAVNTVTMAIVSTAMSEAMFTLALIGSVALAARAVERPSRGALVGLSFAALAAGITRSVGGPLLLLGAALALAWRRRGVALALGLGWLGTGAVTAAVRARTPLPTGDRLSVLHYYVSYNEHIAYYTGPLADGRWAEAADRLWRTLQLNAATGLSSLGSLLFPASFVGPGPEAVNTAPLGATLLVAGAAGAVVAPRTRPALALIGAYAAIFFAWTWPFSVRFWAPIFPLLVATAVIALRQAGNVPRLLSGPLVALVVLANGIRPIYVASARLSPAPGQSEVEDADLAGEAQLQRAVRPGDVLLGTHWSLWLARRAGASGLELEALLPADDRLGVMLGQVDPIADAPRLTDALEAGLDALIRELPEGAAVFIVRSATADSAAARRVAPLVEALQARGRLTPESATEALILSRVTPADP